MPRVLVSSSSITGEVRSFAGSAAPEGYLLCYGQAISRTDYSNLFSILGTSHGQGDGSTTFNLPDYRGMFLRGRVDITTIAGSGSASSNNATFNNHGINRTGFSVRLQSGTLTGLVPVVTYYAIVVNSNTLAFATSLTNAKAGTKIAISGVNSAILVQWEDPDFTSRTGYTVGASNLYQDDIFESHNHGGGNHRHDLIPDVVSDSGSAVQGPDNAADGTNVAYTDYSGTIITTQGGNETRPRNTIINYIIKY